MDFANYWFSAQAGNPPDPGDQIGQSLRILGGNGTSGTPVLNRPVVQAGNRSWTWSGWCKYAFEMLTLFTPCSGTGASSGLWLSDQLWFQTQGTNIADSWRSTGVFRDESAWYHIVFSVDVDNNVTRGYVNGVEAGNANVVNSTYAQFNGTMGFQTGQGSSCSGDGYIADVYLIDGQVLLPTAFGRFNDNGVWVPREVDFTPAEMRWSDFLTVSNGDFGTPAENAFNGLLDDGDGRCFTSTGADLTWEPPADNPATFTTTLEIFNTNQPSQQNISWNGNTVNPTGGWVTVFTDPSPDPANPNVIDVNQPLVIDSIGSQRAELYAVRLDGELVLNPYQYEAFVELQGTGAGSGYSNPGGCLCFI